jgi:hypothetical protein
MNKVRQYKCDKEVADYKIHKLQVLLEEVEASDHWIEYNTKMRRILKKDIHLEKLDNAQVIKELEAMIAEKNGPTN